MVSVFFTGAHVGDFMGSSTSHGQRCSHRAKWYLQEIKKTGQRSGGKAETMGWWPRQRTRAGPGTRTSALPGRSDPFSTDLCQEALCPSQRSHSCPKLSRFPVSAEIPTASFGWVESQVFSCLRCHPETSGIKVILLLSGLSCHQ